jgi:hypothetical protein
MRLPNHLNIVDVSNGMTDMHLKNVSYGYSLFFPIWPFQSDGFFPGVGGLPYQLHNVMAISAKKR